MVLEPVLCPDCGSNDIVRHDRSSAGKPRYKCRDWGAYQRLLHPALHTVGKTNTQMIERKHLTLRTRIKRSAGKTICFSKSIWLHEVVSALFINRYEFGLLL